MSIERLAAKEQHKQHICGHSCELRRGDFDTTPQLRTDRERRSGSCGISALARHSAYLGSEPPTRSLLWMGLCGLCSVPSAARQSGLQGQAERIQTPTAWNHRTRSIVNSLIALAIIEPADAEGRSA
jgi:hypothetical protein